MCKSVSVNLWKHKSIIICHEYNDECGVPNQLQWNLPQRPPLLRDHLTNSWLVPPSVKLWLVKLPVGDHPLISDHISLSLLPGGSIIISFHFLHDYYYLFEAFSDSSSSWKSIKSLKLCTYLCQRTKISYFEKHTVVPLLSVHPRQMSCVGLDVKLLPCLLYMLFPLAMRSDLWRARMFTCSSSPKRQWTYKTVCKTNENLLVSFSLYGGIHICLMFCMNRLWNLVFALDVGLYMPLYKLETNHQRHWAFN